MLTAKGIFLLNFFCQIVDKVIEIKDIIVANSPKSGILEPKSIPKTKDAPTNPNKTPIHCFKFTFSFSIGPLNIFVKIG